jgi:DNA-binding transcriptional regulator YdaS (Cro superfamily)
MNISDLSPKDRKRLAALAGVSEGSLRHVAHGRRHVSSTTAILLERAAKRMGIDLRREQMARGCDVCEFARACRKGSR